MQAARKLEKIRSFGSVAIEDGSDHRYARVILTNKNILLMKPSEAELSVIALQKILKTSIETRGRVEKRHFMRLELIGGESFAFELVDDPPKSLEDVNAAIKAAKESGETIDDEEQDTALPVPVRPPSGPPLMGGRQLLGLFVFALGGTGIFATLIFFPEIFSLPTFPITPNLLGYAFLVTFCIFVCIAVAGFGLFLMLGDVRSRE